MPKRVLEGVVVSSKSDKTVVVKVERAFAHPIYKKIVRRSKKYSAHDELNVCVEGDKVKIIESAPFSKTKKWKVVE
jgi:small subunit ribosomal protein S17